MGGARPISPLRDRIARYPSIGAQGGVDGHGAINLAKTRDRLHSTHPTKTNSYPNFGSIVVDHSVRSSTSLSVTVITCVAPSIATWPKNCNPSLGGRFWPCPAL